MILVTVGTTKIPFQRLLDEVADIIRSDKLNDKFIVQFGEGKFPQLAGVLTKNYFSFQQMQNFLKQADVIICHAGLGTIIQALSFGKKPIVVPRQKRFGEHVNDHEVEMTQFLAKKKLISGILNISDLKKVIFQAKKQKIIKKIQITSEKLIIHLINWTKENF